MRSGCVAFGLRAGTIRGLVGLAAAILLLGHPVEAQTFAAGPVVFSANGSNAAQTQTVNVTLTAASAIQSISIPVGFTAISPEFTLIDQGGCTKDGLVKSRRFLR